MLFYNNRNSILLFKYLFNNIKMGNVCTENDCRNDGKKDQ